MLNTWERQYPGRIDTIFNAIKNVSPSQLADTNLFNFRDLQLDRSEQQAVKGDFAERIRSLNL
jgi:tRNA 2-thiocytidine biosynthesis protein TtcA